MIRQLIPRLDWGRWSGPAIGHERDRNGPEVTGVFVAIAWLGLHLELCLARHRR